MEMERLTERNEERTIRLDILCLKQTLTQTKSELRFYAAYLNKDLMERAGDIWRIGSTILKRSDSSGQCLRLLGLLAQFKGSTLHLNPFLNPTIAHLLRGYLNILEVHGLIEVILETDHTWPPGDKVIPHSSALMSVIRSDPSVLMGKVAVQEVLHLIPDIFNIEEIEDLNCITPLLHSVLLQGVELTPPIRTLLARFAEELRCQLSYRPLDRIQRELLDCALEKYELTFGAGDRRTLHYRVADILQSFKEGSPTEVLAKCRAYLRTVLPVLPHPQPRNHRNLEEGWDIEIGLVDVAQKLYDYAIIMSLTLEEQGQLLEECLEFHRSGFITWQTTHDYRLGQPCFNGILECLLELERRDEMHQFVQTTRVHMETEFQSTYPPSWFSKIIICHARLLGPAYKFRLLHEVQRHLEWLKEEVKYRFNRPMSEDGHLWSLSKNLFPDLFQCLAHLGEFQRILDLLTEISFLNQDDLPGVLSSILESVQSLDFPLKHAILTKSFDIAKKLIKSTLNLEGDLSPAIVLIKIGMEAELGVELSEFLMELEWCLVEKYRGRVRDITEAILHFGERVRDEMSGKKQRGDLAGFVEDVKVVVEKWMGNASCEGPMLEEFWMNDVAKSILTFCSGQSSNPIE